MNNGLLKLNTTDLYHAILTAVIGAVVFGLGSIVSQPNFDIFSTNWNQVLNTIINAAFIAFVTSIVKALGTTDSGNFLGVIKNK